MYRIPEEHGPPPLSLKIMLLGIVIWLALIAGILFGISQLLNY